MESPLDTSWSARVEPAVPTRVAGRPVVVPAPRLGEGRRVIVAGEIDILTAPALDRLLQGQLDDLAAGEALVVDLSGVTVFSAAGLHVLQQADATARHRHVIFRIGRASRQVDRFLGVCGVDLTRHDGG